MINLRRPQEDELPALSALCLRSKAAWGYDEAFMAACVAELTFNADNLASMRMQLAEDETGHVGFAAVSMIDETTATIEAMFIEPDRIGAGVGRLLFDWTVKTARGDGATEMMIEADPGAAAFYRHMGAVDAGEAPSGSIPGRMLPMLRLEL